MSELIRVSGCDKPARTGDVVFVHGLDGDARTTWQPAERPGLAWPDWLGQDLPDVGVWLLGYEVASSAWKGRSMPLADRATNVLGLLDIDGLGERPLVFVTHSLGGLLVKQVLRHACDYGDVRWRSVAEGTRGVVFLSTPHSGADIANWVKYLGFVLHNTVSVKELEAHDPRLRELNIWYRNKVGAMRIRTEVYCEKLLTRGFLVVDETSADPGIAGVVPMPMDDDHVSISKPVSKEALVYKRVKRFIRECLQTKVDPSLDMMPIVPSGGIELGSLGLYELANHLNEWKIVHTNVQDLLLSLEILDFALSLKNSSKLTETMLSKTEKQWHRHCESKSRDTLVHLRSFVYIKDGMLGKLRTMLQEKGIAGSIQRLSVGDIDSYHKFRSKVYELKELLEETLRLSDIYIIKIAEEIKMRSFPTIWSIFSRIFPAARKR